MAMRREIVSLSQLLQRKNNNAQRPTSQSFSQVSANDTTRFRSLSQAEPRVQRVDAPVAGHSSSNSGGAQSRGRPPVDRGQSSQGFQSLLFSQQSPPDSFPLPRSWSQSQDVQDESWNITSQSQSQTVMSQSQAQPHHVPSYSDPFRLQASSQPRTQVKSKLSQILQGSSSTSIDAGRDAGRSEEELIQRLVTPVNDALKDMKMMLNQHLEARHNDTDMLMQFSSDMRSMRKAIERLHDETRDTRRNCDDCHDRIAREAAAARNAFETMGSRMGAMEENVDVFISNMTQFVRDELFALHVQHQTGYGDPPPRRPPYKAISSRPAGLSQRSSIIQRQTSRGRQVRSTNQTSRRRGSSILSSVAGTSRNQSTRRSARLQRQRELAEAEEAEDSSDFDDDNDDDDAIGMRSALDRIESARAKRQRRR